MTKRQQEAKKYLRGIRINECEIEGKKRQIQKMQEWPETEMISVYIAEMEKDINNYVSERREADKLLDTLEREEKVVIERMCLEKADKWKVARELHISESTVRRRYESALEKIGEKVEHK